MATLQAWGRGWRLQEKLQRFSFQNGSVQKCKRKSKKKIIFLF
jgi:hypothetical protein